MVTEPARRSWHQTSRPKQLTDGIIVVTQEPPRPVNHVDAVKKQRICGPVRRDSRAPRCHGLSEISERDLWTKGEQVPARLGARMKLQVARREATQKAIAIPLQLSADDVYRERRIIEPRDLPCNTDMGKLHLLRQKVVNVAMTEGCRSDTET